MFMKAETLSLRGIYKANECTDMNDVVFAIATLKNIAHTCYKSSYTPAMRRRLNSLLKRKEELLKK